MSPQLFQNYDLTHPLRLLSRNCFKREPQVPPGIEAAFEWAHAQHAFSQQQQRRTGAGGFVWSGAVKDDIHLSRDLRVPGLDLLRVHPDRSGDFRRPEFVLKGIS